MPSPAIPFLDLVTPHRELKDELLAVVGACVDTASFVAGPMVGDFERAYAQFCSSRFCVGMANGTDALRLALLAAGIRPGDTVLTVPLTFIATTEAISQVGARPDFVDVTPDTYTMDPEKLRRYLDRECGRDLATGRTVSKRTGSPVTAIIPVHLYGQMADMDPILECARQYRLSVIEDACQAHGARYFSRAEERWRTAGSMGHAAAFSFYPGKNLGACGEAGAVTTDDEELAARCRMLRDHGQSRKYWHEMEGYNGRLDAIQAGILSVKLGHLPAWNAQRQERGGRYDRLFADLDARVVVPAVPAWSRPVYHLYAVQVPSRTQLMQDLSAAGIGTGIHYPIPLHLAKPYEGLGYAPGDFPIAEGVAARVLSLPMYPTLAPDDQARVAAEVSRSLETASKGAPACAF